MPRPHLVAGGITLAVVALLATATPASAHDELISSDPAADAVLADPPSEVTLTYSADLLDVGAAVVVAGADGGDHAVSEPTIDGDTVTVTVDPDLPDGGYEVRWRVVSSDGHPISGVVPFVVGDGEPLADGAAESDATESAPSPDTDATADSDATGTTGTGGGPAQAPADDDGVGRTLLVAAGGAVVALALLALLTFLRRRRTAAGPDDAPSSTTDKDQP